jgi:hypothetical protein
MMASTEPKPRRVRPAFRRFAIVAFAVLLPVAAHALWDYVETRRLVAEMVRIRDAGEPLADRDFGPTSPQTAEQKLAARLYLAAGALAVPSYDVDRRIPADLDAARERLNGDPEMRADLVRRLEPLLAQNADALALLRKASALPFSAFHPGTEYSFRTSSFWALAGAGQAQAQSLCLAGEADRAVEATIETLRVQRLERRRSLYSSTREFQHVVPFVLSHCAPSPGALQRLQLAVDDGMADIPTVAIYLSGSLIDLRARVLGGIWPAYGRDVRAPENVDFRDWPLSAVVMRPWITNRLVRQLQDSARLIEAVKRPASERAQAVSAVQPGMGPIPTPRGVIHLGRAPQATERDIEYGLRGYAALGAARVAIAVERYRADNAGRMPAALDDLVPRYIASVPVDPYTDTPLRIATRSAGYAIYSVGQDGKDDGGSVRPGPPKYQSGPPSDPPDVGVLILPASK